MSADDDRPLARIVVPEGAHERVDAFAAASLPTWLPSRNRAKKALKSGLLLLDDEEVETSRFVRPGQVLTLYADASLLPEPLLRDIEVVYEDEVMAVVVKPPGLLTNGSRYATLERALPHNLTPSNAPDAMPAPAPVHRLDRSTTGLVVCAKAHAAQVFLGQAFQERRVDKRYRAIVAGRLEGSHEVCEPIDGRQAHSTITAVEHTPSLHVGWLTTVELVPHTGRTHQLRRHCTHLGHPILGERLYPGGQKILKGAGLFLAAVALRVPHPDGQVLDLQIEEPAKHRTFRAREARRHARHEQTT